MNKIMKMALVFTLVVATLVGCGGKEVTPDMDQEPKSVENQPDTGEKSPTTISILTAMAYGTERFDELLENYKKENPHIAFEVQHAPNDYSTIVKSRVNSGQMPDVLAAQTGSDVEGYYEYAYDFTDDPIIQKFNPDAINTSKSKDQRVMSLPWTYESMAIIYNKKLFEQAGITELPKTLDELEVVCKKLDDAGIMPFYNASQETWVLAHVASHFISSENNDPNVIVADISEEKLTFSQMNNFKNLFRLLDMMIEYGPEKPLEVDWELSENMLANDQAAMIHMGDWCEATLKQFNENMDVAFLPVPISSNPEDAAVLSSISWQYVLHKDSEHLEESKKFLEYMLTSEDAQDWMTGAIGAVPAVQTDMSPAGLLANDAKEYIETGEAKGWNHTLWPAGYNDQLGSILQGYMLKQLTPEQAMEEATNLWMDMIQ